MPIDMRKLYDRFRVNGKHTPDLGCHFTNESYA